MSPFQAYVCGKRHHGFGKGSPAPRTAPAAEPPPLQGPALPARAARGGFFLKFHKKIFRRDGRFCSISPLFCAIIEHRVTPRPVKNAARGIGAPRIRAQIFPCTTAPPGRARAEKPGLPSQCAAVIKRPPRRGKRRMRLSAQARRAAPPEIWRRPAKRPGAFSIPRPAAFPARARAGGNRVPAPRPSQ